MPVAIFDASSPPALAFMASLGRRGVPLTVCGPSRGFDTTRWSRYCTQFQRCPPLEDHDRFRNWLRERLRDGSIGRVAPTSDLIAFHLAELGEEFPLPVRRTLAPLEDLETCLIKTRFAQACARIGQPTPETYGPGSVDDAAALARGMGYPVVVKPNSHLAVGVAARGAIVRDETELRANFVPYPIPAEATALAQRYPELRQLLLQRYVPSASRCVYSVGGYKDADVGVVAALVSIKREQWPPDIGISMVQDSCPDDRVLRRGLETVDKLLSCGLFELELVVDGDTLLAIDLNPRAFGFIDLDIALGNDLPWLWYRSTLAALPPGPPVVPTGVLEWRLPLPFHVGHWMAFALGPDRGTEWRDYVSALTRPSISAFGSWRDPLPKLLSTLRPLRHPGGLVRPFARRRMRQPFAD
jgi:D-aspartate ligase